jgi:hypothetical protein
LRQFFESGTVMKQARVEEVGRDPARFGFEFAEAEHLLLDREADELLAKVGRQS